MCYWDTACVMGLIIGNNYQNVLITGRYWTIITSSGREYPLNNMEFSNQFSSNRINYEANHRCYQWLYCHGDGLIVIFVVSLLSLQVSNTIQMKIFQSANFPQCFWTLEKENISWNQVKQILGRDQATGIACASRFFFHLKPLSRCLIINESRFSTFQTTSSAGMNRPDNYCWTC